MIGQRAALRLFGCEVFDPHGHRIGIVGELFLEENTEQPAWITVQTGLFGTNESFVPLEGAAFDGDTLTVAVFKDAVRHAPLVALEQGDLSLDQERALYLYYGMEYGVLPADSGSFGEVRPSEADWEAADPNQSSDGEPSQVGPSRDYVDQIRLRLRRWVAAG